MARTATHSIETLRGRVAALPAHAAIALASISVYLGGCGRSEPQRRKVSVLGVEVEVVEPPPPPLIARIVAFASSAAVACVLTAICLWAGMKLTKQVGEFKTLLKIAAIATVLSFIPYVGWLAGGIAMWYLVCKWLEIDLWPDAVLLVLVSGGISMWLSFVIRAGLLGT